MKTKFRISINAPTEFIKNGVLGYIDGYVIDNKNNVLAIVVIGENVCSIPIGMLIILPPDTDLV